MEPKEVKHAVNILKDLQSEYSSTKNTDNDGVLKAISPSIEYTSEPEYNQKKIEGVTQLSIEEIKNEVVSAADSIKDRDEDIMVDVEENIVEIDNDGNDNYLKFKLNTGDIQLNDVQDVLTFNGNLYNAMKLFLQDENYKCSFKDLISGIWNEKYSDNKHGRGRVRKDIIYRLRKKLKINTDNPKNEDIFINMKGEGYRLDL